MPLLKRTMVLLLLTAGLAQPSMSEDSSGNELRSLDGQVQEIKSDVLGIAAELENLEERLLYPSNTQFSLFVAFDNGADFRLDAVKIEIDGELAIHHIYSFQELEALRKGGVQRIFTGNVVTGSHELRVTMLGKQKSGKDFEASNTFTFSKDVKPKVLGVTLAGHGANGIQVGAW